MDVIEIRVDGDPQTQAGTRAVPVGGGGRFRHISTGSRGLAFWRQRIADAAQAAMGDRPLLEGPLALSVVFSLQRPKSRPKKHRWPDRRPDLSKLLRAVEDALSGVVYADDAQVCQLFVSKRYAGAPELRLPRPGAWIMVGPLLRDHESGGTARAQGSAVPSSATERDGGSAGFKPASGGGA